jgi:hypothetical protein
MRWNNQSRPEVVDAPRLAELRNRNASLQAFTFVREPVQRFLSGCARGRACT